ncbi:TonB-dependent receptor domain-containing protein [Methylogaea oryzae]|uniref:TonB-dependent receptor plug domain-containing protein n=1 Tax=Methylogaea oryzae TaxID=1295382 RepID=UPI0006CF9BB5
MERIEVIRGPGAAMWGSNAVNGVINIITKKAKDSRGLYATAGTGTEENGFAAVRYGGQLGEQTYYKGYVKYFSRDTMALDQSGHNANDAWENTQGGFKLESSLSQKDSVTLQGDVYQGNANALQNISVPMAPYQFDSAIPKRYSGGNVLGRWDHRFSDTSDMTLKMYFDHTEDATQVSRIRDTSISRVDTYDADWQHRFLVGDSHAWTWGLGYRYSHLQSTTGYDFFYAMKSPTRDTQLFSAFLQDEITLVPDRWRVIFGTRVEHNDYSGFEVQPNGRLVFTPTDNQTIWASISRAVRIPNRLDHDMTATFLGQPSPGVYLVGQGNSNFKPEELIAHELGYRIQPTSTTSVDIATFYNDYSRLTSASLGTPYVGTTPSLYVGLPIFPENNMRGKTYGAEVMGQWRAASNLRFQANYTYLQINLSGDPSLQKSTENASPHHQFSLRTSYDITETLQADASCATWINCRRSRSTATRRWTCAWAGSRSATWNWPWSDVICWTAAIPNSENRY